MFFHMIWAVLLIPLLLFTTLPIYAEFHEEMVQFMPNVNNFDKNWEITQIQGFKDLELEWSSKTPNGLIQRFVFTDEIDKTEMVNTVSVYDFASNEMSSNIFKEYVSTLIENDYHSVSLDRSLQKDCFATMINEKTKNEKTSITCKNSRYVIISTSEQSGKVFHQGQQLTTLIAANGFASLIYENIENSKSAEIPKWIKNNAGWWSDGITSDKTFVNAIQFLIDDGIIEIPDITELSQDNQSSDIPEWIKNNAHWWSKGKISDNDFVKGIQYLVQQGIIQIK